MRQTTNDVPSRQLYVSRDHQKLIRYSFGSKPHPRFSFQKEERLLSKHSNHPRRIEDEKMVQISSHGVLATVCHALLAGSPDANYFDNIDFQPGTGRMVVLEDGEVEVVTAQGTELRGNDVWMLLPDGADRDVQSDGAIRILSLTDTGAEPTGWTFDATGQTAYVNIQHRTPNIGAVLKITGFSN